MPNDRDVELMRTAHAATIDELGDVKIDGPRLAWDDVRVAPKPILRPWSLDGAFHHDDGCFELNPVTWYTLATYGVALRGPAPEELQIHVDAEARCAFVKDNTAGYWQSIAEAVTAAVQDPDSETFSAEMTTWCVLGAARMLYSARTGDVASKSRAGEWLIGELPEHRSLLEHALAVRRTAAPEPDSRETAAATAAYLSQIIPLVATAQG